MKLDVDITFKNDPTMLAKLERIEGLLTTIQQTQGKLMSVISDFSVKQNAFNAEISSDLDDIKTAAASQLALIQQLQQSQGTVTPEDQAIIDKLEADGTALVSKADATAGKTPPAPPTDNPTT